MRRRLTPIIGIIGIALLLVSFPGMAIEPDTAAASQITVTRVTLDPAVFFEDDTGIITIEITNNGPESVAIRRATMYDEDILVISSPMTRPQRSGREIKCSSALR